MKNKSFNIIMPREKESIARKVKKAKDVHEDPLRRDKKPRVSKGGMSLILLSSLLCKKNGSFPCTMMVFFLKEGHFSLSHFPTNFLLFSLMFSPGSCCCSPCSFFFFLMVQQHVPRRVRGMLPSTKEKCQIMIPPFKS